MSKKKAAPKAKARPSSSKAVGKEVHKGAATQNNGALQLPPKEAAAFRQVVAFYESKQYKKGLKAAEALLKCFPGHGETTSMKGLILYFMGKKEEGVNVVKEGLRSNLKSCICWNVLGIVHRSESEYEEAKKCYMNALKIDEKNHTVLRDLSQLNIQLRDFEGFVKTENTLLLEKSDSKIHWMGFAVANHLAGNSDKALEVLDAYQKAQIDADEKDPQKQYEASEIHLFKAMVMEESGHIDQAIILLDEQEEKILDKLAHREAKARLLLKADRHSESSVVYEELITMNPDNRDYYVGLLESHDIHLARIVTEKRQRAIELLESFSRRFSKSPTPRRLMLDISEGESFSELMDGYARAYLRKGIPSLFSDVEGLYADPEKVKTLERLFLNYLASLRGDGRLPLTNGEAGDAEESRSTELWALVFLANHFRTIGNIDEALRLIDEALVHTPTLHDLNMTKAKILRSAGAFIDAAESADKGRQMDLADRYLNCDAVEYFFQCGKSNKADELASLFTREDNSYSLYGLQASWFENARGEGLLRNGEIGKAMKQFRNVIEHFQEYKDDEFDFHVYCLRRTTLRTYVQTLRCMDKVRQGTACIRAHVGMLKCYLRLDDKIQLESALETNLAGEELEEYRKERAKEEKKRKKAEQRAMEDAKKEKPKSPLVVNPKETADPLGEVMSSTKTPIQDAMPVAERLMDFHGNNIDALALVFEVCRRGSNVKGAVRALKSIIDIVGKDSPIVVVLSCISRHFVASDLDSDKIDIDLTNISFEDALNAIKNTNGHLSPAAAMVRCYNMIEQVDEVLQAATTSVASAHKLCADSIAPYFDDVRTCVEVVEAQQGKKVAATKSAFSALSSTLRNSLPRCDLFSSMLEE